MKSYFTRLPKKVSSGEDVKADDFNKIVDTLHHLIADIRASELHGSAEIGVKRNLGGTTAWIKRSGGGSSSAPQAPCPFGRITTYKVGEITKTGILGGIIYCGDQNFEVPNQTLDLAAAGDWLVYIKVTSEANRDDDNEIFLPGVKTGTAPGSTWDKIVWSSAATYPANALPTVAAGTGDVVLPIGRLKIADGVATLAPAGCGHFRISQCAGILSFSRE